MNLKINIEIDGDWSEDPLAGLVALHQASKQIDGQLWSAVTQAKLAGRTWEEIGRTMGLSKQTVFERYAPAVRNTEAALHEFLDTTSVGDTIPGTVASITKFGIFVRVEPGVEGLVHVSETKRPLESFTVGEQLEVRLERFHLDKKRLAFSLV